MNEEYCDPETGVCTPGELSDSNEKPALLEPGREIIYVGDPMCSWCYGITNHLKSLRAHYPQYKFTVVVGGLRPGGGDEWNQQMKDFLRHHWEEVNKRSGQPFGYKLFDQDQFEYDTAPACQAVVASRKWIPKQEFDFFEAVSRKFYFENEDPKTDEFYQSICEEFGIPYAEFLVHFRSEDSHKTTYGEFNLNRQWGVRGYPTVIFRKDEQLYQISNGYLEFEHMKATIEKIVAEPTPVS